MTRRIIDISVALQAGIASDPPHALPEITYSDHHDTAPNMAKFFGISASDFPDGEFCAVEKCKITTHNGTHLDAPYHFNSTMNHRVKEGGEPAMRIDEVPLDWCYQPGVKLDFRQFEDGYVVRPQDVEAELERIGHKLSPFEIVVINTRAAERYGKSDFLDAGCGMGRDATLWLLERGIRLVGTDAWSWDAPFTHTRDRVRETGDLSLIWEGHRAGHEIGYCHLEKLTRLDELPAVGFDIVCFPVKVHRGSAGWTRAVAIFND